METSKSNTGNSGDHECCYHAAGLKTILADREAELLKVKGNCSTKECILHYAHSGPCNPDLARRVDAVRDTDGISDGFHTFGELYEHRLALTAALCRILAGMDECPVWRSRAHHPDGDPMFDGYFIVGINLPTGTVTYHYKLEYWDAFVAAPEIEHAPKWDGALPGETVVRLLTLATAVFDDQPQPSGWDQDELRMILEEGP